MHPREARACRCHARVCALMVSHNFRAASSQFTGLMSTASNALFASIARVQRSRRPVHAKRAVWRVAGSARNASATTNPSRPGMRKSHKIASGTSCVARNTPLNPPFARSTANPCASRATWALSRKSGSSSTISTRGNVFDAVPASFALSDIPFPPRLTLLTLLTLIETTTARWSLAPTSHCVEPTWCMRNVQIVKNDQSCVCRGFPCFRVFHWVKPLGFAASTGRTRIRAPGERT